MVARLFLFDDEEFLAPRPARQERVTELGRVRGTTYFADLARHPENERTPGVLVVRLEAALLYFNVEHVRQRVFQLLEARAEPTRLVIFSFGSVPRVDLAGAELVGDLLKTLKARGIAFRLADAHGEVRDALRRAGFEHEHGDLAEGQTVDVVLSGWLAAPALAGVS